MLSKPGAIALFLSCMAAGIYLVADFNEPARQPDRSTDQFFAQSMPDSKGRAQSFSQWKGKPLLVNFWATWCAPCVKEMPELSALQSEVAAKGIQIIGVGIDSADNISSFSSKYAIDYPLYVSGVAGSRTLRELGNQSGSLPFTLLIGRDGKIRKTYLGRLKMDELRDDLLSIDEKY